MVRRSVSKPQIRGNRLRWAHEIKSYRLRLPRRITLYRAMVPSTFQARSRARIREALINGRIKQRLFRLVLPPLRIPMPLHFDNRM